jgi:UPF0042 nucleotide-binding protein
MDLVVITGMSGAGRRTAAHAMEDLGWYVVDNLPSAMLPALTDDLRQAGVQKVAVALDVRTRGDLAQIPALIQSLSAEIESAQVLFLEAEDPVIVRRQESSRRPVPLQGSGRRLDGIRAERARLAGLRAAADLVIDTSSLTSHQLTRRVIAAFGSGRLDLTITVLSFGFARGVPVDADMVLDVRFLANPHWVPGLRPLSGLDPAVAGYVMAAPGAADFLDQLGALFDTVRRGYLGEGKHLLTVAIGCTGGRHRSVAMAEELAHRLRAAGRTVAVVHRDLVEE